ncbi:MAG: hypothetical protein M1831_001008 [Alyxoria varia]|nr:MAG: hypothetical protein M1831_001008 [Alyxoria varia]
MCGVFTHLVEQLGVKDVQFEELLSLEVEDLRALSPLYGIIFLFKFPVDDPSVYQDAKAEHPPDGQYDSTATDNGLFFAHQSIQNACGTQAVLSVLLNKDQDPTDPAAAAAPHTTIPSEDANSSIDIGPTLRSFAQFTSSFPPSLRGDALSNSSPIRRAHNAFARSNPFVDEVARDPDASQSEDVYHFVAYVPVNGVLYELDGLREHPISHGPVDGPGGPQDFPAAVVPILQKRIARYPAGEIHFNLLALTKDLRVRAREVGDTMALVREEEKRRNWAWENELRAWGGWVGFTGTVLRETATQNIRGGGDAYDKWVEEARGRTKTRVQTKGRLKD